MVHLEIGRGGRSNHMGFLSRTTPIETKHQQWNGPHLKNRHSWNNVILLVAASDTLILRADSVTTDSALRSDRSDVFGRCPFLDSTPTFPSPAGDMSQKTELLRTCQAESPVTMDWIWHCGMQRDSKEKPHPTHAIFYKGHQWHLGQRWGWGRYSSAQAGVQLSPAVDIRVT